jgi:alpha-mannosidase
VVRKAGSHPGELPKRWGLVEARPANVILSALKPGKDGTTIVRVFEAAGKQTRGAEIRSNVTLASVHEANLMEDTGAELESSANGAIQFDLRPYEIKTVKLRLAPMPPAK